MVQSRAYLVAAIVHTCGEVMRYKLIYEHALLEFERRCSEMLQNDWTPLGGVSIMEGHWFAQAFVK
jgi:hypothetical protein